MAAIFGSEAKFHYDTAENGWAFLQSVAICCGTEIVLIYALCQNSQGKSALYFIRFISTEKWVGCKHFKSYIFEVFADKHGQVAGDSMTHSRRSSGGSRLLMKALYSSPPPPLDKNQNKFLSQACLAVFCLKEYNYIFFAVYYYIIMYIEL